MDYLSVVSSALWGAAATGGTGLPLRFGRANASDGEILRSGEHGAGKNSLR